MAVKTMMFSSDILSQVSLSSSSRPPGPDQTGPLPLVEVLHYCALIGPELPY